MDAAISTASAKAPIEHVHDDFGVFLQYLQMACEIFALGGNPNSVNFHLNHAENIVNSWERTIAGRTSSPHFNLLLQFARVLMLYMRRLFANDVECVNDVCMNAYNHRVVMDFRHCRKLRCDEHAGCFLHNYVAFTLCGLCMEYFRTVVESAIAGQSRHPFEIYETLYKKVYTNQHHECERLNV